MGGESRGRQTPVSKACACRCLADRDFFGEGFAGKEFQRSMHGELLGMPGRSLSADNNLPVSLADHEIANPPVGQLKYLGFHAFGERKGRIQAIADLHGILRAQHCIWITRSRM